MIKPVRLENSSINFAAKPEDKNLDKDSRILPNNLQTRMYQKYHKTTNAFLEYPVKGLRGDVNSDFYEFLSMGIIPYLAGSAMFMVMFNLLKDLKPNSKILAGINGKKMALGVVLYGLMKTISNDFVTRPVAWGTGVDIELPVQHVYNPLPKEAGANANIMPQLQQRKVYDSKEFFRKDLIDKDPKYGNAYYENIAKKVNLGENLNDPVSETTPIIQSIVSMTKTAKSLSSYAWAGLGVGLAVQDSWQTFFNSISNRKHHIPKEGEGFFSKIGNKLKNFGSNLVDISKSFCTSFVKSCKSLWNGEAGTTGFMKHAGKGWILATLGITIGSVANVIIRAKNMGKTANIKAIDENKESTVI